jgi:toxin-antitoxin system PIN domain toxin
VIVPDINLLLYATVDGVPQHAKAHEWWVKALNDTTEIGLPSLSLFGFLRIVTNPKAFKKPMPIDQALALAREWLERPQVRLLLPGPRHLEIAFGLLEQLGTAANLTTDAQLAALAIEHQALLCSNDTDFHRFRGLRWMDPLG